eukprot:751752-Hanusia_phi.AAC.2
MSRACWIKQKGSLSGEIVSDLIARKGCFSSMSALSPPPQTEGAAQQDVEMRMKVLAQTADRTHRHHRQQALNQRTSTIATSCTLRKIGSEYEMSSVWVDRQQGGGAALLPRMEEPAKIPSSCAEEPEGSAEGMLGPSEDS